MNKRLLCILLVVCCLTACNSSANDTIAISHTTNGSMGENWGYEMSVDGVLQEREHSSV